jgi:hypothetical protein
MRSLGRLDTEIARFVNDGLTRSSAPFRGALAEVLTVLRGRRESILFAGQREREERS